MTAQFLQRLSRARNWIVCVMIYGQTVTYHKISMGGALPGDVSGVLVKNEEIQQEAATVVLALQKLSKAIDSRWLQIRENNRP